MSAENVTVQPGQVWADNDPRCAGRTLRVDRIFTTSDIRPEPYAVCTVLTTPRNVSEKQIGRTTRIRLDRFEPNQQRGYSLISEAPQSAGKP